MIVYNRMIHSMGTDSLRIFIDLDNIVMDRLFGSGPWHADLEIVDALSSMITRMGLDEQVPSTSDTWRSTPLGKQLNLDLIMVFLGLWNEFDMVFTLEQHGLIDEFESDELLVQLSAGNDPESVLRGPLQRAYYDYYSQSKYRH